MVFIKKSINFALLKSWSVTVSVITLYSSGGAFDSLIPGLPQLQRFPIKIACISASTLGFQRKKCGLISLQVELIAQGEHLWEEVQ